MSEAIIINPATGQQIASYQRITVNEAFVKIDKANRQFEQWRHTSYQYRAMLMRKLAEELRQNRGQYAALITDEMGKMKVQALAEVDKCVLICEHYAEHAAKYLANEVVETEAQKSYVNFSPVGVILAVMPWNFPLYQVIRFAAPAIMAGNVGLLKHASNVQGNAFALEEAFSKAGFPEGIFSNLNIPVADVEPVIAHPHVRAVTLTGSEAAGKSVASVAGRNLKKTVMELGGNDAYIILEDADIDAAVALAVKGRLQNAGQTCISAKRFIVVDVIYNAFLEKFIEKMKEAKMGDPNEETNVYGPMAREDLRNELHEQVQKSVRQGSKLLLGGYIPKGQGAYYPATILADVLPGTESFDNELFGPVASVIKAKDEQEAIALANQSQFGLGSGVITGNTVRGEAIALQLEAGSSFVNALVVSDPRLPFGGVKNSGYGRELAGYGIKEFTNIKSVWIN